MARSDFSFLKASLDINKKGKCFLVLLLVTPHGFLNASPPLPSQKLAGDKKVIITLEGLSSPFTDAAQSLAVSF